jgi:rubrerythrin
MASGMRHEPWAKLLEPGNDLRAAVLNVLRRCYVREKQHAMRFRQHAERVETPNLHWALLSIALEEDKHAESIGEKLDALQAKRPKVFPVHFAKEENSWDYLRTDLQEEHRCDGELKENLSALRGEFPEIAELIDRLESDGERHRRQIRELMARCEPESVGPT